METILKSTKTDLLNLLPHQLVKNEDNPRSEGSYIDPILVHSIERDGIINPVVVKKLKEKTEDGLDKYLLVDGNRRFANAEQASNFGQFTIPARPIKISDKDILDTAVSLGITGRNLTTIELGEAFIIMSESQTQKEIADKYGFQQSYVSQLINAATKLPSSIKEKIETNEISLQGGLELFEKFNGNEQKMLKTISDALEKAQNTNRKKNAKVSNKELKEAANQNTEAPSNQQPQAPAKPKTPLQKLLVELEKPEYQEFLNQNMKVLRTLVGYEKGEVNMQTASSMFMKD